MERTATEQLTIPSCQMSSGTVSFDCGYGPSVEEPKTTELSIAHILSERIVPLLRYLDGKMAKYAEPKLAGSYVELMRSRTKAKVAAAAKVAETVASLTSKCATVTATLLKRDEQLQMKELECAELRRKLAAEEYLHTKKELECKALRVDITNAQKLTVEICKKLKLSRKRFEREFKRTE